MSLIRQTLQQQRAKHALEQIQVAEQKFQENKELREKFVASVKNTPASILINGLGQAMATLRAQAKDSQEDPQMLIFYAVQGWLCRDNAEAPYCNRASPDLMNAIIEGDRASYLLAQAEALAYLEWYKKFAETFLRG